MKVEFPARARCVEGAHPFFRRGEEVSVIRMLGTDFCDVIGKASSFKPVIRVR